MKTPTFFRCPKCNYFHGDGKWEKLDGDYRKLDTDNWRDESWNSGPMTGTVKCGICGTIFDIWTEEVYRKKIITEDEWNARKVLKRIAFSQDRKEKEGGE